MNSEKNSNNYQQLRTDFSEARRIYRKTVRKHRLQDNMKQEEKLMGILSANPSKIFSYIKSCKKTSNRTVDKLVVGEVVYSGQKVPDGFYESMTSLKKCDMDLLQSDEILCPRLSDYKHILKLCQDEQGVIPPISLDKSNELLKRAKKEVKDFFSISALHFQNAGEEGQQHFNALLNAAIADANNATIEELNIAHGLILFKGHNKDKSSDRSYRTISTCPFVSNSLDLYLRDLYGDVWHENQTDTQYQGLGSSHDLASVLVTEVLQFSQNVSKKPVFLLSLDA